LLSSGPGFALRWAWFCFAIVLNLLSNGRDQVMQLGFESQFSWLHLLISWGLVTKLGVQEMTCYVPMQVKRKVVNI
jgi:hypothetical protein